MAEQDEPVPWRKMIARSGTGLLLTNVAFWICMFPFGLITLLPKGNPIYRGNDTYELTIEIGLAIAASSLICAVFARGRNRVLLIGCAVLEAYGWWFMTIGLV